MTAAEIIALITAAAAGIVSIINAIKNKKISDIVSELHSSGRHYYVICPDCKRKIYLKDAEIQEDDENVHE